LTIADLPSPGTKRWVPMRKAVVVAAVRGGLLSLEEACSRYTPSKSSSPGRTQSKSRAWPGYAAHASSNTGTVDRSRTNDFGTPTWSTKSFVLHEGSRLQSSKKYRLRPEILGWLIPPHPRLQVNVAEQFARSIVAAAHVPSPNLVGDNESSPSVRGEHLFQRPARDCLGILGHRFR
jgi:uncharacterized protein DUF1153